MTLELRAIQPQDNQRIATIIRQVLTEFGANQPGFAWADPELESLSEAYCEPGSAYYVATWQQQVVGGAGIAPFACEYPAICELQKMYLLPDYRSQGNGQALMQKLMKIAQSHQYQGCYLETFRTMKGAMRFYERSGFQQLTKPLGHSAHTSCDRFYIRWFCHDGSSEA
ncbi:MAG: GNAT family N-acetyltransferase [Cyanobacteria bacterium P01_H01_bin.58]